MGELEKIYDIAVEQYNKLADLIENVYSAMKKTGAVRIPKKTIMDNYDFYIQSLLCRVAIGDGKVDPVELSFIKNIARYEDYLKEFDASQVEEMFNAIGKALEEVPLFVQLLATADKSMEENGKQSSYSKDAFTVLLSVVLALAGIDRKIEENELNEAIKVFEPIIDFYNANNIKFMDEDKK